MTPRGWVAVILAVGITAVLVAAGIGVVLHPDSALAGAVSSAATAIGGAAVGAIATWMGVSLRPPFDPPEPPEPADPEEAPK